MIQSREGRGDRVRATASGSTACARAPFRSGIHAGLPESALDAIASKHPLGWASADDLVGALYLASDASGAGPPARRSSSTAATLRAVGGDCVDAAGHELGAACSSTTPAARPTSRSRDLRRRRRHRTEQMTEWAAGARWRATGDAASAPGDVVGAARLQQHRVPRDDLRRQPPGRSRRCRSTGASRRRRSGSSSSTPQARRLVCDDDLIDSGNDATDGPRPVRCAPASRRRHAAGWERSPTSAPARPPARRAPSRATTPPAHVHVGHDRSPEGRDAHARQPGVEELRPHRRVRFSERRRRPGVRAALPRRRARPRHDHADRGGCHRRSSTARSTRRGGRRDRAVARDDGVARTAMVSAIMALPGIEQRDLSSVRVIINGGEKMPIPLIERIQRDVPVGVVRRRVRPHRDRLGRHVPRPRQHR